MKNSYQENYSKKRLITSYFSVVIIFSLVLFLISILGLFLFNSKKITNYFKEQIVLTVYLENTAKPLEIKQLIKSLALNPEIKKVNYISKEKAAEIYANDIGEDFMDFLGYNPLLNAIDIHFNAKSVAPVHLKENSEIWEQKSFVKEIVYDKPLLELLDKNIEKATYIIFFVGGIFIFIAILLINSSIRLAIYSKRFLIKTMQLVGATKSFIRRPFVLKYLWLGVISSCIGIGISFIILIKINEKFPALNLIETYNPIEIILFFVGIFITGLIVIRICTYFATQRFLNLNTNNIY